MIFYASTNNKKSWTVVCLGQHDIDEFNASKKVKKYCKRKKGGCFFCKYRNLTNNYSRRVYQRSLYTYKNEVVIDNKLGQHITLFNEK